MSHRFFRYYTLLVIIYCYMVELNTLLILM